MFDLFKTWYLSHDFGIDPKRCHPESVVTIRELALVLVLHASCSIFSRHGIFQNHHRCHDTHITSVLIPKGAMYEEISGSCEDQALLLKIRGLLQGFPRTLGTLFSIKTLFAIIYHIIWVIPIRIILEEVSVSESLLLIPESVVTIREKTLYDSTALWHL